MPALRSLLLAAAGLASVALGCALATLESLSFPVRVAAALAGLAGYLVLFGLALERRWCLDRKWRHDPPGRDDWHRRGDADLGRRGSMDRSPLALLRTAALAGAAAVLPAAAALAAETVAPPASEETPAPAPSPTPAPSPAPEEEEPGFFQSVRLSGFVDLYASWNANHPSSRDSFLPGTGSTAKKANQLGVNLVAVEAVKDAEPLGFRIVLNWGTATDVIHAGEPTGTGISPDVWEVLQYASIAWKVPGSRLLLEGGILPCHVGAESYFSKDNPHYTRSFVAEYTPWYQAGIKASLPLGAGFSGQLHVMNGWQVIGDNNDGKSFGTQLAYSSGPLDVALNGIAGPELPDDNSHWRTFGDLVVTWRATPSVTVSGQVDVGSQSRPGLDAATWWGAFVSARAALTDRLAIAARFERFSDPDAGISGFAQRLWGVTGTLELRPHPRLILKLEGRYDRSTEPVFDGPVPGEGKESEVLAVLGAVATF